MEAQLHRLESGVSALRFLKGTIGHQRNDSRDVLHLFAKT